MNVPLQRHPIQRREQHEASQPKEGQAKGLKPIHKLAIAGLVGLGISGAALYGLSRSDTTPVPASFAVPGSLVAENNELSEEERRQARAALVHLYGFPPQRAIQVPWQPGSIRGQQGPEFTYDRSYLDRGDDGLLMEAEWLTYLKHGRNYSGHTQEELDEYVKLLIPRGQR